MPMVGVGTSSSQTPTSGFIGEGVYGSGCPDAQAADAPTVAYASGSSGGGRQAVQGPNPFFFLPPGGIGIGSSSGNIVGWLPVMLVAEVTIDSIHAAPPT